MKDPLGVSPSKGNQGTTRGLKLIDLFLPDGFVMRMPRPKQLSMAATT